jgi:PEP-CTERM motif
MTIKILAAAVMALSTTAANAVVVSWADWQSATSTEVFGQMTSGPTTIDVTFSTSGEAVNFVQLGTGTNYFTEDSPAPFTGGIVDNAPPAAEMISLSAGGTKTITFSQAITDPYIAFVSWNGNLASFTQPFEKISEGCGYWGCGTFSLGAGNSFVGSGEVHGILRFVGTFDSVTFTDSTENWHGLTIGIGGVAAVPEPASWAMLIAGFGLTGAAMRRRRTLAVA